MGLPRLLRGLGSIFKDLCFGELISRTLSFCFRGRLSRRKLRLGLEQRFVLELRYCCCSSCHLNVWFHWLRLWIVISFLTCTSYKFPQRKIVQRPHYDHLRWFRVPSPDSYSWNPSNNSEPCIWWLNFSNLIWLFPFNMEYLWSWVFSSF